MVSPISFGSTYKVSTNSKENEVIAFDKFQELCDTIQSRNLGATKFEDTIERKYPHNWSATQTLVVPETLDYSVEKYCALHGINFTKIFTHNLIRPQNIFSRINPAAEGKVLAFVDAEKLENLTKHQTNNFAHVKNDYEGYFNKNTELMLKSGDSFSTSSLYITPKEDAEDVLAYIEKYGADAVNDNSLIISLNQETLEPDHCIYYALKDLGIKSIPVYLNKEDYKIADALGLID